jgi:hypothetical protein
LPPSTRSSLPAFRLRRGPRLPTPACPRSVRRFTPSDRESAVQCRLLGVPGIARHPCYSSSPSTPCGDRSGLRPMVRPTMPSADFCAAVGRLCSRPSPEGHDTDLLG